MGKKISPQNLGLALGQYLEQELAPISTGLQKVALYLAIPVIVSKAPELTQQYHGVLGLVGAIDDAGMLDIDVLHTRLKEAMHKAGKVTVMGIVFDEADIDKVHAHAVQHAA